MFRVIEYDSVGSTNDEAKRLAREGAANGTVVTAREQTAGRGRIGRSWASPPGNLYLSALLRLDMKPARVAELSFVAALAVADAVEGFGCRAELKWPNDVLVGGAKISGVLIEQAEGATVLGIGVNVRHCPAGTPYPVTSLLRETAAAPEDAVMPGLVPGIHAFTRGRQDVDGGDKPGHDGDCWVAGCRMMLLSALSRRLDAWLADGFAPIRADWLARAHPLGTKLTANGTDGAFAGLDEDGALLLDTEAGRRRVVSGDVQAR